MGSNPFEDEIACIAYTTARIISSLYETKFLCFQHQEMNDKLKWLFSSSMALYPSVYMYDQQSWNKAFAYGRLEEAFRLATWVSKEKKRRLPVFPYFRHLYEGKPLEFDYLTDVRNY